MASATQCRLNSLPLRRVVLKFVFKTLPHYVPTGYVSTWPFPGKSKETFDVCESPHPLFN